MAQTKTRKSRSSSSKGGSKSGSSAGSRGSTSKARSRSGSSSGGAKGKANTRKHQATSNESAMATVARKAKGPALAGGAALVGLAGGLALKNGRKRSVLDRLPTPNMKKLPKLSVSDVKPDSALKSLGKAAGEVAQRSHRVGDVASEVEKASQAISKKA
jgi:hypothetical protein